VLSRYLLSLHSHEFGEGFGAVGDELLAGHDRVTADDRPRVLLQATRQQGVRVFGTED